MSQLPREGVSPQEQGLVKINRLPEVVSKDRENRVDQASFSECQDNIQGPLGLGHLGEEEGKPQGE